MDKNENSYKKFNNTDEKIDAPLSARVKDRVVAEIVFEARKGIDKDLQPLLARKHLAGVLAESFLNENFMMFLMTAIRILRDPSEICLDILNQLASLIEEKFNIKQEIGYDPRNFRPNLYSFNAPSGVSGEYWALGVFLPVPEREELSRGVYAIFDSNFEKRAFFQSDLVVERSEDGKIIDQYFELSGVDSDLNKVKYDVKIRGNDADEEADELHKIFFNPQYAERFAKPVILSTQGKIASSLLIELMTELKKTLAEEDAYRARWRFEKEDLVRALFLEDDPQKCGELVSRLKSNSPGEALVEIYEASCQKSANPRFFPFVQYEPNQFATKLFPLKTNRDDGKQYAVLRIDLPEIKLRFATRRFGNLGFCARAYLCFDETFEKRSLFVVEINPTKEGKPYCMRAALNFEDRARLNFDEGQLDEELEAAKNLYLGAIEVEELLEAKEKRQGPLTIRGKTSARYTLEHQSLPSVLLGEDLDAARRAIIALTEKPGAFLRELHQRAFDELTDEAREAQITHEPSAFSSSLIQVGSTEGDEPRLFLLRLDMPPAERAPLCPKIYFFYDDSLEKRAYFTLEKSGSHPEDSDVYILCGWNAKLEHLNYQFLAPGTDFEAAEREATKLFLSDAKPGIVWSPTEASESRQRKIDEAFSNDPQEALELLKKQAQGPQGWESDLRTKLEANGARLYLEREILPSALFDGDFGSFWTALWELASIQKNALFEWYQKTREKFEKEGASGQRDFKESEFSATFLDLGVDPKSNSQIGAFRLDWPNPECAPCSIRTYMVFDELFERRAYFTVERALERDIRRTDEYETILNGIGTENSGPSALRYGTRFTEDDPEAEIREVFRVFTRDPSREEFLIGQFPNDGKAKKILPECFRRLRLLSVYQTEIKSTMARWTIEQKELPRLFHSLKDDEFYRFMGAIAHFAPEGILTAMSSGTGNIRELPLDLSKVGEIFENLFEQQRKVFEVMSEISPIGKLTQKNYLQEQFSARSFLLIDPDGGVGTFLTRIDMPEPERVGLCARIYLCCGRENYRAYFTIEKSLTAPGILEPEDEYELRGVDAEGRHLDYDATFKPGQENEELELVRKIFFDPNYPRAVLDD